LTLRAGHAYLRDAAPPEGAFDVTASRAPIRRIVVGVQVGTDRLAASDDPIFLELFGPGGREFRLAFAQGRQLRRGAVDRFVLGGPGDPDTNVACPDLNDPTSPPLDANAVQAVCLRKGLDPIPNVRGHGEMDDRLQVVSLEVELHVDGEPKPRTWTHAGGVWLGLVCGLRVWLTSPGGPG
jgi:hypothetical protein